MAIDPELYRPLEKEQAFHPQPGYFEAEQWWYHDAIFDNGYSMVLIWSATGVRNQVILQVCDPDGKMTFISVPFHPSEVTASTEKLDIRMGDNRYHGEFPRYEMHFRSGDMGADLVFECLTQPAREPPDGVYIGRAAAPATPMYMSYCTRPRCKYTGKLIVAGREMSVSGEGCADHQWGNSHLWDIFHHWYWGTLYLPNHTFVWWDGVLTEKLGYQRTKWLWAFKGEKLFEYLRNGNIYVESSELGVDKRLGLTYPRKVVLIIDDSTISGTATYRMKRIITRPPGQLSPFGAPAPVSPPSPRYFRYLSDVHYNLNIEGEKIEGDGQAIHELAI